MKYVIGCDPDSKAHGIAVFIDGNLTDLKMMTLMELQSWVRALLVAPDTESLLFSIEDVTANKFMYARNTDSNPAIQSKIAIGVGKCQHSYTELTRMLDWYKVKYVTFKPSKSNWAKSKDRGTFERFTGWTGRSNEDTRSSAYFGYLALK